MFSAFIPVGLFHGYSDPSDPVERGPKNEEIHGMARGNWVTLRGLLLESAVYVLYDQYPLVN